jgi:prepilin-type N-terminal cleavage/methylation domain-containing protein
VLFSGHSFVVERAGRRPAVGQAGFTLVELLVVLTVVALLASAAMVGYRQSRIRTAEAAAVAALHAINQGQFAYMQTCGNHRYAPTLVALGSPAPGSPQGFVSPDLALADPLLKSGYLMHLTGTQATEGEKTCTGVVPLDRYLLTADPQVPGVTGNRFYGTNTDRVIYSDSQTYMENMPEAGPPGHGAEIR